VVHNRRVAASRSKACFLYRLDHKENGFALVWNRKFNLGICCRHSFLSFIFLLLVLYVSFSGILTPNFINLMYSRLFLTLKKTLNNPLKVLSSFQCKILRFNEITLENKGVMQSKRVKLVNIFCSVCIYAIQRHVPIHEILNGVSFSMNKSSFLH
jgi:hypothetical protein